METLSICQGCHTPNVEAPCPECGCRVMRVHIGAAPEAERIPVIFKLRSTLQGRHIHVELFQGRKGTTLANMGRLVFEHVGDWQMFGAALDLGLERFNLHFGRPVYGMEHETDPEILRADLGPQEG